MIVVIDEEDRENEGDLVVAAELITEEQMAFLVANHIGHRVRASRRQRGPVIHSGPPLREHHPAPPCEQTGSLGSRLDNCR
ncbi:MULTISPECIES: 3,4-dihydroxy-2-butanone-4-phosphate synthase [unclassified Mycobacterium]|uniref:3,4-dihydroxy-2-butanone-4-phosphate synthase n=1 Tax=unclassified Mycobacterium TaxID=2642494 RepID=UPI0029C7FA51|nr:MULTISPECIES: 3,4-dihydroxy-2-butanone-4-phosphate synthase [unclassified Mycobacterium]